MNLLKEVRVDSGKIWVSKVIRTELSPGIIHYIFDPSPNRHFANSILVLINKNKVLFVDTAFQDQAMAVLEDIEKSGLSIEKIIISHFHDDHMQGLKVLPETEVYGSDFYKTTLDLWTKSEEHRFYIPTKTISLPHSIKFGVHRITLIPFPGHSLCTLLTEINGKYLHIADELMFSTDGRPIIPTTDPGCFIRHLESLERLQQYSSYTLIPSHGPPLHGKDRIGREINNRIAYFSMIINNPKKISYKEAIKNCDCEFLHNEWHESNYDCDLNHPK